MSNSRTRTRIPLWVFAIASAACIAGLIAIAVTPRMDPIPEELITPVMPIITE